MNSLTASDLKTFVGSKDYQESLDFYQAMGWQINWDDGGLAELELGGHKFFLQKYYQRQWCENSMLHVTVNNAEAWYQKIRAMLEKRKYGAARVNPPKHEPYGALVTYVWDPVGVLWHLAEPVDPKERGTS